LLSVALANDFLRIESRVKGAFEALLNEKKLMMTLSFA